jgi:hypothetical protein
MKTSSTVAPAEITKAKLSNQKRAKQLRTLLRIINDANHNIYICVQDKKAGTVTQYSSDLNKFGNLHIAKSTKDIKLQKVEKFTIQLSQMQDKVNMQKELQSQNADTASESKKSTQASIQEV